jgi:hypothetical protein
MSLGGAAPGSGAGGVAAGSAGAPSGGQGVAGRAGTSGSGSTTPVDCMLTPTGMPAPAMPSVVLVTIETDLVAVTGGRIQFGKDESYGYEAPVDLAAEDYRTLLLGMPFDSEVHYRVELSSAAGTCTSEDQTLTTGAAPSGVPVLTTAIPDPSKVTPGFVVVGNGSWATIWNHLGELVWAHKVSFSSVTRVDFSYDGTFLVARDGNPSGAAGMGIIRKLSLDGAGDDAIALDRSHHDFTALPDNGFVFFVNAADNCGKLMRMAPDGTFSELFNTADAFETLSGSGSDRCHMNSIHYHELDDSITFSVLMQNAYVKISSQGELAWVLDGDGASDFTGDGSEWDRQHGHTMTDANHLFFFNNRSNGETALIREVELDTTAGTAKVVFEYDGGGKSQTLGDVQKLSSGNLLVTYCNDGLQREITMDKTMVREFLWPSAVGYATHRTSLYGPPPLR